MAGIGRGWRVAGNTCFDVTSNLTSRVLARADSWTGNVNSRQNLAGISHRFQSTKGGHLITSGYNQTVMYWQTLPILGSVCSYHQDWKPYLMQFHLMKHRARDGFNPYKRKLKLKI
ncbi:unnamed protein product [Cylicocyclus nassatus]|uniref:Uncharacterized protein n=1 Tax=Cylicocyclus nassatus TaxID=53992 RepID=A0AA36GXS7_CYLNA|nr:unnamed protein product [Cylicocyclus nassatus]